MQTDENMTDRNARARMAGSNSDFAWRPSDGLETVIRRALIGISRTVVNGTADPCTLDRGVGVILAAANAWADARNGTATQPADPDAAQHRADLAAALRTLSPVCGRGHLYPDNPYRYPNGERRCRICHAADEATRRSRKAAA